MDKVTLPTNVANAEALASVQNNAGEAQARSEAITPQVPMNLPPAGSQGEKTPTVDTVNLNTAQVTPQEVKPQNQATTGKKWGVGIASGIIPGLGQAINGQWGKAAAFFFGNLALNLTIKNPMAKMLPGLVLTIGAIVDAVKNAKSKAKEA